MNNNIFRKIMTLILITTHLFSILNSISIVSAQESSTMLSLEHYPDRESNWVLSVNASGLAVEDQFVELTLPNNTEKISVIKLIDTSRDLIKLPTTNNFEQYTQKINQYHQYLKEKEQYYLDLKDYNQVVETYNSAVAQYDQAVQQYQQEYEQYLQDLAEYEAAQTTQYIEPVTETPGTEESEQVIPESTVSGGGSPGVSLSPVEPVAPVWDESIVNPESLTQPKDPYDVNKEKMWQLAYVNSEQTVAQVFVPTSLNNTQISITTSVLNHIQESYLVKATNTVYSGGVSQAYTVEKRVTIEKAENTTTELVTTTQTESTIVEESAMSSSEDTTYEVTTISDTTTFSDVDASSENNMTTELITEMTNEEPEDNLIEDSTEKINEELTMNVEETTTQAELLQLNQGMEVEKDSIIGFETFILNYDDLPNTIHFEWITDPDTTTIGTSIGEFKALYEDGTESIYEIELTVIDPTNESLFSKMSRFASQSAPRAVDSSITFENLDLKSSTPRDGSENMVWLTSGDDVVVSGTYSIANDVNPGDYFTLNFGEMIQPGALNVPRTVPPLYAANGSIIANGVYDATTNTAKYTFTDIVSMLKDITGSFQWRFTELYANHKGDKVFTPVSINFAGETHTELMAFDYGLQTDKSIQVSTISINGTTSPPTYTTTIYVNQTKNRLGQATLSIFSKNMIVDPNSIKIYKVPDTYGDLPSNFRPNTTGWTEISNKDVTKIKRDDGGYDIQMWRPNTRGWTTNSYLNQRERYVVVFNHQEVPGSTEISIGAQLNAIADYDNPGNRFHSNSVINAYVPSGNSSTGTGTYYYPLNIKKLDEAGNAISSSPATFTLYGHDSTNNTPSTAITSISTLGGIAVIRDTIKENGTYWLFETKSPIGYQLSGYGYKIQVKKNPATGQVSFLIDRYQRVPNTTGGFTYTQLPNPYGSGYEWHTLDFIFDVKNTAYKTSLTLVKKDSLNKNVLAGAEFRLTKENDTTFNQTIQSDKDGKIQFTNLTIGKYTLQESKAPTGYKLNSTPMTFEVVAKPDNSGLTINYLTNNFITVEGTENVVNNQPYTYDFSLIKKAQNTQTVLPNAEFTLTKSGETNFKQVVISGDDGSINFNGLTVGSYTLTETKAPSGYEMPAQSMTFDIAVKSDGTGLEMKNVANTLIVTENSQAIIYNKPLTYDLSFMKRDKGSLNLLANAEFTLTKTNDASFKQVVTTDSTGLVKFSGLLVGTYQLTETKSPSGYKRIKSPMTFELIVSADGKSLEMTNIQNPMVNAEGNVLNEKLVGEITLVKVDGSKTITDQNRLNGAQFQVVSINNLGMETTDFNQTVDITTNGQITIPNLPLGRYRITEIKAPNDYQLLSKPFEIEVVYNEVTKRVESKLLSGNTNFVEKDSEQLNQYYVKNYLPTKIPNTGGSGILLYTTVGLLLMVTSIASGYLYLNKTERGD
ncbi:SpaA isopeptide-forming pilin-related protein [Globicatella sanguinis]|uniref:SpaA isopeptide-forming pilin-related protein n=1 Tax=Globicatella sanguinis TaxID=13076 RepID=UPI0025435F26|nr:SpaA isopeptide-forming pilin-related protein [Globicatella sanguinis]MDK7631554.1 SpaA isopeptide-forming pilin-related protein [Globicatella sanguinis]WIK66027.1 SpaA isopeptide-forming pilin-related protein [Globicatella sanguinis]WKT55432.1 SpaA isopeptide-forming pilin-related protein [Globicatella sanguinis]